ncbi:MAG: Ribokinase [candidate division TM6 bacterium GW2011_GWF2_43_17]|nr:MAG: Ribokinase [candidate division TM6 bacterium GW2011_GWF2_43_17]HAU30221.1 hypothetical protein [Candidatus Dependentiae bacterium]
MQKYHTWLIVFSSILFSPCLKPTQVTQPFMGSGSINALPILVIGGAMCDFFLELDPTHDSLSNPGFIQFEEGKKISLKQLQFHTGGGGLNAALALGALGHHVALYAQVGMDPSGEQIIQELQNAHIQTDLIFFDQQHYTGTSFILPSKDGNNTILMNRGASRHLIYQPDKVNESLPSPSGMYLAPLSGNSMACALDIVRHAHEKQTPILCNPSSAQIEDYSSFFSLLPFITVLLLNEHEAEKLALYLNIPSKTMHDQIALARIVQTYGPSICLITNGSRGALCVHKDQVLFQDSFSITPQKSVGAGDTFGSTFFSALLHGFSIKQSLLLGALHSASILSEKIPHHGLCSLDELIIRLNTTSNLPQCYEIN